ncbi:hypothetical protein BDR07DRAFT_517048 [Suillus spraguei]|nr:hypothetical protein BDR07DRAFT_517048 [Suillus spraguei]
MQAPSSNIDSPPVAATTGGVQKPTVRADSGLEMVRNSVRYHQRQYIKEKADTVRSNTLVTVSSPAIYRLPTEILSEIFMYCLPHDEHLVPRAELAPILFTSICRRWREVAIGLPRLWRTLQLAVGFDDWQKRALCYDSWLKRSGGCPLSLRLLCHTDCNELQNLLKPYIQQISFLTLDFITCDGGPFMTKDFRTLKELTINPYVLDDPARVIDRSLSKLPVSLRRINMKELLFDREQLEFFTDSVWAHLTHVEVTISGLDAFTRILRLCPNLTSLTMDGVFYPIETVESATHVNLQSLCMSWSGLWSSSEDIAPFKVITLPNLRVVEARHNERWPHKEFMEFLTRSECSLERLVLDCAMGITAGQREEYATLVPSFELICSAHVYEQ